MNINFFQNCIDYFRQKSIKIYCQNKNEVIYIKKNSKKIEKKLPLGFKLNISGQNNIITINGTLPKRCNLNFKIKGNNNNITINGNIKNPSSLKISIIGSENIVELNGPISFNNSEIEIIRNNNKFSIQPPARIVKDCYFNLCGISDVIIGQNCGLNMGLYAIINNNYKNRHKLQIGNEVFIGKDVIIRTSDGHTILDPKTNIPINEPQDIIIGNHVWIGARNMILKGAQIPDNSILGAQSVLTKKFEEPNIILAGNPAKIIKRNTKWDVKDYYIYMTELEQE